MMAKRSIWRRVVSAVLAAVLILGAVPFGAVEVSAATSGIYSYTVSGGKATITGVSGQPVELVIPAHLDGYPVVSIGFAAFSQKNSLISVTIPDGVEKIELSAFWKCTNLTTVVIPNSVTSIEEKAFFDCSNLANINLPDNITTIKDSVFSGCGKLSDISMPENVKTIEKYAFSWSGLQSVVIPNGVIEIGEYAFFACKSLAVVDISNTVETIGVNAFGGCDSLSAVIIPADVKIIRAGAFSQCSNLTRVVLPEGITQIEREAFAYCYKLAHINIPNSVTDIGVRAFYRCYELADIQLPNNISKIESGTFEYCNNLIRIMIPESVETIGEFAFANCENLLEVVMPRSIVAIEQQAFYMSSSLTIYCFKDSIAHGYAVDNAVPFILLDDMPQTTYTLSRDETYDFGNAPNNFGSDYYISKTDFTKLTDYIKREYSADYAKSIICQLEQNRDSSWTGSCYGMATTAILDKRGQIGLNENFDPSAATLHDVQVPLQKNEVRSAINYYHLSQQIPFIIQGYDVQYSFLNGITFSEKLQRLVSDAKAGKLMLFNYQFSGGAHTIAIIGYEEAANGSHNVIAYDNRYPNYDLIVSVAADYSKCVVQKPYGNENVLDCWFGANFDAFDKIDIDGSHNNMTIQIQTLAENKPEYTQVSFVTDSAITIINKAGQAAIYNPDTGAVTGTMPVYGANLIVDATTEGNATPTMVLEVPDSTAFTFASNSGVDVSLVSNGIYAAVNSLNADMVAITKGDGVTVSGTGQIEYAASLSVNNALCDMVQMTGTANGNASLTYRGNDVIADGVANGAMLTVYSNTVDVEKINFNTTSEKVLITGSGSGIAGDVDVRISTNNDGIYDKSLLNGGGKPSNPPTIPDDVKNLNNNYTFYRKQSYDTFSSVDTPDIMWNSTKPSVLKIDEQTGRIDNGSYLFAKTGTTTIQAIIDGQVVKSVDVKITWQWWQWILVVVLFGWIWL
jgi:hypothetical protein